MQIKVPKIVCTPFQIAQLASHFETSKQNIRIALRFQGRNQHAKYIRQKAVEEYNGVVAFDIEEYGKRKNR